MPFNLNRHKALIKLMACYFIVIMLAILTMDKVIELHATNFQELVDASFGVLNGKPHWIAYQNRLLGPALVYLLHIEGLSPMTALKTFFFIGFIVTVILNFYLLKKILLSNSLTLLLIVTLCFSFIALQHKWLYPWDIVSLFLFSNFCFFAIKNYPTHFFIVLYALALFNRESAYFIILFLLIKNVIDYKFSALLERSTYYYTVLFILGYIYTGWIRRTLFIAKMDGQADEHIKFQGNHIYFQKNIEDIIGHDWFSSIGYYKLLLLGCFILIVVNFFNSTVKNRWAIILLFILIILSILHFGLVFETRIYIELIPFLIFALALLLQKKVVYSSSTL